MSRPDGPKIQDKEGEGAKPKDQTNACDWFYGLRLVGAQLMSDAPCCLRRECWAIGRRMLSSSNNVNVWLLQPLASRGSPPPTNPTGKFIFWCIQYCREPSKWNIYKCQMPNLYHRLPAPRWNLNPFVSASPIFLIQSGSGSTSLIFLSRSS